MAYDPALDRAYKATRYRIISQPAGCAATLDMRIGRHDPRIDQLLAQHAVEHATFISACNPYSQALSAARNQELMDALCADLKAKGWRWLPGQGVPDGEHWQAEASVLVMGMDLPAARQWGQRYQQNALVHVQRGQPPQLIWLVE